MFVLCYTLKTLFIYSFSLPYRVKARTHSSPPPPLYPMAHSLDIPCWHLADRRPTQVREMLAAFEAADGHVEKMPPEHAATLCALDEDPDTWFDMAQHVCRTESDPCRCLLCCPRPPVPCPVAIGTRCPLCPVTITTNEDAATGLCGVCRQKLTNEALNLCAACGAWAFYIMCPSPGREKFACQGRADLTPPAASDTH